MMDTRKSLLLLFAATQLTCASGLFTAPAGASFTCTANPPFIAAFGDVSVISVLIIEPAGFPVPDGTVAQFFTTLGHIDSQGKTKDGVVRVNFVSDSRSGTASISVLSGGPAVAPSASPSPGGGGAGSGTGSCSTTVTIGSARPALVKVVPNPPRLANNRCTTITATVLRSAKREKIRSTRRKKLWPTPGKRRATPPRMTVRATEMKTTRV